MKEQKKHLYYLDELSDYKVDSHYADVRGWPVKDRDNRVIGKVDNLLVNKNLMKVVYLDVDVDKTIIDANYDPYRGSRNSEVKEFVNKEGENHVIIPIGMVHIHEDQKYVHTEEIDHQTFAETKRYRTGENVNRAYETVVLDSYNREGSRYSNQHHLDDASANHKESPYRADRDQNHVSSNDLNADADAAWSEERRKLEAERHKIKEERLKLEEERTKLEMERRRRDVLDKNDERDDFSTFDKDRNDTFSSHEDYSDDDSFYKRGEFERSNYRNS